MGLLTTLITPYKRENPANKLTSKCMCTINDRNEAVIHEWFTTNVSLLCVYDACGNLDSIALAVVMLL